MDNPFCLTGKKILVTGASSGIGRQVSISLSKMGVSLVLLGRNDDRLKQTMSLLDGNDHVWLACDINDTGRVRELCSGLAPVNGVVHAAGILKIAPIKLIEEDDVNEMIRTNYSSPFSFLRHLLNQRKITNGGSVILITSVNGVNTNVKGFASYAASKAALNSVAKNLALEYAGKKIRFNTIAPGMIKTEMYFDMITSISHESLVNDKKRYPLGDYGEPDDVANACVYLLSDASKWVTGTTLVVDGGLTIN